MLVDVILADRLQFAFTIMFHYLFPITTMGLAPFVVWYSIKAAYTQDETAAASATLWTKIFSLNFAAGVVTGIPMEFQFGMNWATFSEKTGNVVGQPLAMEGLYAFFLESIFLGIVLYGKKRVRPIVHTFSAVMVLVGAWISGYFIVVTDAWMQHPVGYSLAPNGTVHLNSLWLVVTNPFALWQYAHVLTGAGVTGGFVVAGVGALYLLLGRYQNFGQRFVHDGILVALVFSILTIYPTGDRNGNDVAHYQPIKLAAMEGIFHSTRDAPLALIGMPDLQHDDLLDPVEIPDLLSFLAYGNMRANVAGLSAYTHEMRPPVELTYYAYHIMIGLGGIFIFLASTASILLLSKRLYTAKPLLWLLLLVIPFPYIANEAGWVVSEVGRQPWIVYGLMRTADGISSNVSTGETLFTLIGFTGIYAFLGFTFLSLTLRQITHGPNQREAS